MVLPYLKGLIIKKHFYLISWVYFYCLIFSYQSYNIHPLPLMSKGESDLVWWLPSSPKGEIVGIMFQVLSLMATHSEVGTGAQRLVQVMAT